MNAIAPIGSSQPVTRAVAHVGIFSSSEKFEFAQRVARVFSESKLVPTHLQGKLSDCLIALHMAERLGDDPLITMQNIMVVNGRPGFMTSYMIARANAAGVFRGRITWETKGSGKDMEVTASATLVDTGEVVSAAASMAMAEAEGWTKNAKYRSMPEHMLRFRSAAMLIRLYCPEVMLGMQTAEEIEAPGEPAMRDVTPPRAAAPDPSKSIRAPKPPAPAEDVQQQEQKVAETEGEHQDFAAWLNGIEEMVSGAQSPDDLSEIYVEEIGDRQFSADQSQQIGAIFKRREEQLTPKKTPPNPEQTAQDTSAVDADTDHNDDDLPAEETLLDRGRAAAMKGTAAWLKWRKDLTDAEREEIEPHRKALSEAAKQADGGAA